MQAGGDNARAAVPTVDVLIAGLGPGGCAAALTARALGLSTLAVEARGLEPTRSRLVLVRPRARAALLPLGLGDITEGRRTTTILQIETRLRAALVAAADAAGPTPLALHWHTSVVGLEARQDGVVVSLRDEATGALRAVFARHVIDAAGGRLEPLGRPARVRAGPSHQILTAEYNAPPWFEGIVGVSDRAAHETYLLFPTWGRKGVIAYFDTPPGRHVEPAALVQRFDSIAERLALGAPKQPVVAVDAFQRALLKPSTDRVVPIGDAVGTVDVLLASGMSNALEDAVDAARAIAAAQRAASVSDELALTRKLSVRILARHRASMRSGRLLLAVRPLIERAWPQAPLASVGRDTVGPPPLLWPAVRFVFGRRPQAT